MTLPTARHRRTAYLAALIGVAVALTACTTDTTESGTETTPPAASSGAFPATVEGAYGEITVSEEPQRVVLLDTWYIDATLALGVQPVAIRYPEGGETLMLSEQPWLEGRYTGTVDTALVSTEWKAAPEAIAEWDPDLIIGAAWMMDEPLYEQLSEIAPTWARPTDTSDLREVMAAIGNLTGHAEEAESLSQDVDAAYEDAAAKLPGLTGKTFISGRASEGGIDIVNLFPWERLGMVPADNAAKAGDEETTISLENLDQLDADLLAIGTWPVPGIEETLKSDPRFVDLPASKNGAALFFDSTVTLAGNGPISTQWLLDTIVEQLKDTPLNTSGS